MDRKLPVIGADSAGRVVTTRSAAAAKAQVTLVENTAHQAWYAAVNALFAPFRRLRADYSVIP